MRLKKTYILAAITILLILFAVLTFRKIALLQQHLYTIQPGEMDIESLPAQISSQFNMVYLFLTLTIAIAIFSFIYFSFIEATKEFKFVKVQSRKDEEESDKEDIELGDLEEEISETEKESLQKEYINNIEQRIKNTALRKDYSIEEVCDKILSIISKEVEIVQGEIFIFDNSIKEKKTYKLVSTFAYYLPEEQKESFEYGEGLVGQVAKGKDILTLNNIPKEYIKVTSGLGESTPSNLTIIPIAIDDTITIGVIELATFQTIKNQDIELLKAIAGQLSIFLNEKMDFQGFEKVDKKEIGKEESTKKYTGKGAEKTTGSKTPVEKEQKSKEKQSQNNKTSQTVGAPGKNKKTTEAEKQEKTNRNEKKSKENQQQKQQDIEKDSKKNNETSNT